MACQGNAGVGPDKAGPGETAVTPGGRVEKPHLAGNPGRGWANDLWTRGVVRTWRGLDRRGDGSRLLSPAACRRG